jgi:hypothetical protein
VWRKDGKEILYLDRDRVWSVRVNPSGGEVRASDPELLFPVRSLEGGRRVNGSRNSPSRAMARASTTSNRSSSLIQM